MEEPEALLGGREGEVSGAGYGSRGQGSGRRAVGVAGRRCGGVDEGGERGRGGVAEDVRGAHGRPEDLPHTRGQAGGQQRVTAQVEEPGVRRGAGVQ